jgi:RNA polymerase sigma-70 factor (ECF subfamily)
MRAFEALMRRHNRLVFRTVRSVIRSDAEAEDVTQDAWLAAYRHIAQFEGRASFSTWLTRIAIRIALLRIRQDQKLRALSEVELEHADMTEQPDHPARMLERRELTELLERAIDRLPLEYRVVLVLREVEQRSTTETAQCLGTTEENVRVRLHRSRAALRELLKEDLGDGLPDVFAFDGERCNRMTTGVLGRLARES